MKHFNTKAVPPTSVHEGQSLRRALIKVGEVKSKLQTFNEAWLESGQSFPPHTHVDCEEIFYVVKGRAKMTVAGKTFVVKPGDVVIVEEGEMHAIENPYKREFRWLVFRILL